MFDARAGSHPPVSVYERVLGTRFSDLAPQLQAYFGPIPDDFEGVGTGRYEVAGLKTRPLRPLFRLLGHLQIAFAEHGRDVPFTIRNTPTTTGGLRATRVFEFPTVTREMRDEMLVTDGRLFDRLGSHGRLEVELDVTVADGSLHIKSHGLALRVAGGRIPLPRFVTVTLTERALPAEQAQRVDLRMTAPMLGEIYRYTGTFTYALRPKQRNSRSNK